MKRGLMIKLPLFSFLFFFFFFLLAGLLTTLPATAHARVLIMPRSSIILEEELEEKIRSYSRYTHPPPPRRSPTTPVKDLMNPFQEAPPAPPTLSSF
ncbi:hypothetical protein H6P81_000435 [Aristolochia fimbriata]|uniref:Uncharacterized protein n=1 Tax=Aristolochia fimbriata TaxID=158543 RepID=A0AAV7F818_ARIFI|nr:hypothetical protein H6P81_000435 [Aristolochia fimbriata]